MVPAKSIFSNTYFFYVKIIEQHFRKHIVFRVNMIFNVIQQLVCRVQRMLVPVVIVLRHLISVYVTVKKVNSGMDNVVLINIYIMEHVLANMLARVILFAI